MMVEFSEKFVQKCEEYVSKNPEVAKDVEEFIRRCGRLGLYNLKMAFGDCSDGGFEVKDGPMKRGIAVRKVYIPDDDYNEIKAFLEKKGILRTVTSLYYFSALMVILGYWKLPPRI